MSLKIFHEPCDGSEAQICAAIRAIEERTTSCGQPTYASQPVLVGKTLLVSVVFEGEPQQTAEPATPSVDQPTATIERKLIRDALAHACGRTTAAARLLGIRREALMERMKRVGLTVGTKKRTRR